MTALDATQSPKSNAVGFGGTHYSAKLTRICLDNELAIGHIISRHSFDAGISKEILRQAFDRTVGGCETAVVDWKGLNGKQRQNLLSHLENWNVRVERC
jgi:D-aminoacyl-tRNA deacylase